jgi:hypothetical protein
MIVSNTDEGKGQEWRVTDSSYRIQMSLVVKGCDSQRLNYTMTCFKDEETGKSHRIKYR